MGRLLIELRDKKILLVLVGVSFEAINSFSDDFMFYNYARNIFKSILCCNFVGKNDLLESIMSILSLKYNIT